MFELAELTTQDGLLLQGLIAHPKDKQDTALVWVHGLTGNFYGNLKLIKNLADTLTHNGIAFVSFNNRGHDMLTGFKRKDPNSMNSFVYTTIGAGYEIFEECVLDIEAMVSHLVAIGYKKIILAGHSSGANKVSYYQGGSPNSSVCGVILLSPMSDRLNPSSNPEKTAELIKLASSQVELGQGNELQSGLGFFPMTASRFLSLTKPNSAEDQFGYGDNPPQMQKYAEIKAPLLVILAEEDEYKDRPIKLIEEVFAKTQKSVHYESKIISGATHGFDTKFEEVTEIISCFIKQNL